MTRTPATFAPLMIRGIMPRSGTNFLADALSLHPDIAAHPNEIWEFPHYRHSALLLEYVRRIAAAPKAARFDAARFLECLGNAWLDYFSGFVPAGKRILLKEPSVTHLDTFFSFFPRALLLILVRDGRDLVSSALNAEFMVSPPFSLFKRSTWGKLRVSDFERLCREYADAARAVRDFEQSETAAQRAPQILRVHYESLHEQPDHEVRRILEWARLDTDRYDWQSLERLPVRGSSFLRNGEGRMDFGKGQSRTKDFKPVGRWRQWDRHKKATFERVAGGAMRALGYDCQWTQSETTPLVPLVN